MKSNEPFAEAAFDKPIMHAAQQPCADTEMQKMPLFQTRNMLEHWFAPLVVYIFQTE